MLESTQLHIRQRSYRLHVSVSRNLSDGASLEVELDDSRSGSSWRGCFKRSFIELMSQQTGNFKQFPVFVDMLVKAMRRESDDVVQLDVMSHSEILEMRSSGPDNANLGNANDNKRYLLLIYSTAFDKVYYPLALTPCPAVDRHRTGSCNNLNMDKELVLENLRLKREIDAMVTERSRVDSAVQLLRAETREQFESMKRDLSTVSFAELESKDMQRHMDKLSGLVECMFDELHTSQQHSRNMKEEYESRISRMQLRINELERLLDTASRTVSRPRRQSQSSTTSSKIATISKSPQVTRQRSASVSSAVSRTSSTGSKPAFKRFDPTAYVKEKAQKLRQRSQSRSNSAMSRRSDSHRDDKENSGKLTYNRKQQAGTIFPSLSGSGGARKSVDERLKVLSEYFQSLKLR